MATTQGELDGDAAPQLSDDALAALQSFYTDRDEQQKRFEELKSSAENPAFNTQLSMDMFTEDWNASQFWYSDSTATALAKQLLAETTCETRIAVICAPSVFIQLKNILMANEDSSRLPQIYLFEFDERFAVLGNFVRYDFQYPLRLPEELKGKFDRIICDPPFLSTDCQTKAAMTVRWLSRRTETKKTHEQLATKIVVCTGERMESLIVKIYPGIQTTTFRPEHAQGRLSNEFRCYSNFECDDWGWQAAQT